ncbi:DinB family protein [Jatrophihabitans sp. YIM 134969]
MTEPPAPPPETTDWTFVIETPCAECGFDPAGVDVHHGLGERITTAAATLARAAQAPGGSDRPAPLVWSPVEYAAHVRDTCTVFGGRVDLMRAEDGVRFPNWDQDAAAVEGRYWELDPADLAGDLTAGAAAIAARFAELGASEWAHRGLRSNGSAFTVETLAVYFLHDLEHHVHDVRG